MTPDTLEEVAALLAFSYGLLAAEVELAKLEGFPAAIVR